MVPTFFRNQFTPKQVPINFPLFSFFLFRLTLGLSVDPLLELDGDDLPLLRLLGQVALEGAADHARGHVAVLDVAGTEQRREVRTLQLQEKKGLEIN